MHIVEAGILAASERHHLGPDGRNQCVRRPSLPVPVGEPDRPFVQESAPESSHLAGGDPQGFRRLRGADPATL